MHRTEETRSSDGTKLRYTVWGEPRPGRRIALVHSLAMNGIFWSEVAEALSQEWEILAVDCRGHGESGKPAGPYTVELFADDLAAVLDHAGWDEAIIAGASMGGCVALATAARHPQRVEALGLIDTTAYYGPDAESAWEGRATKALDGGMSALIDFQKTRWFSDTFREAHPDRVKAAIDVFLANEVDAYAETCRMLGRCDMRDALGKFDMPVEIVVGEEDYATPVAMADALAEAIPDARMTVLPKVRHFTPLEVPQVIARHLQELAERR